jgi:23S rRNA (cytidine2498-2'-O)-methyltransferase
MPAVFACEPDWSEALAAELRRTLAPGEGSLKIDVASPGCVVADFGDDPKLAAAEPIVAFAEQTLPAAEACRAASVSQWAEAATRRSSDRLDALDVPWRLHVFSTPFADGSSGAGRAKLVEQAIVERMREVRRRLLRRRNEDSTAAWRPNEALVQVLLTAPDAGWISVVDTGEREAWRYCVSPFVAGRIEPAEDKLAPSRAFAKLVEAERRLGRQIAAGETCVDLGASPGSWSYTALRRNALVTAVDRSPLRDDLMADPGLTFVRGDAFAYWPEQPVDWLLSDVIAFPDRICEMLSRWLGERRCRRFCVTIKFRGRDDDAELEQVKQVLRTSGYRFGLRRLTANKNEACAFGESTVP